VRKMQEKGNPRGLRVLSAVLRVLFPPGPFQEPAEVIYTADGNDGRNDEEEQHRSTENDQPEDRARCQILCAPFTECFADSLFDPEHRLPDRHAAYRFFA